MRLRDALRTTAAVREFSDEPVSDEVVYAILDTARFSPSGGNRQGWRVVLIRDCQLRRALRDLYRPAWREYLAQAKAGLVAWAPITDRERERQAIAEAAAGPALTEAERAGFGENLDRVPVLLVRLADLRTLAATDRDHDRYTFVGGASMYPFAWSILLAAREHGLGGVLTTMLVRHEAEVRTLLAIPDEYALAAVMALGRPIHQPSRLRRAPVEAFTTIDHFDGVAARPRRHQRLRPDRGHHLLLALHRRCGGHLGRHHHGRHDHGGG